MNKSLIYYELSLIYFLIETPGKQINAKICEHKNRPGKGVFLQIKKIGQKVLH